MINKLYLNRLYQFITVKSLTIWSNLRTIFSKIQVPLIRFRSLWRNMRGPRLKNANNKLLLKKQSQHRQSNNTKQSRVIYSISFCEMIRDPRHSSSRAKRQETKWSYPKVLFNRSQSKIQLVRMHPSTMLRIRTYRMKLLIVRIVCPKSITGPTSFYSLKSTSLWYKRKEGSIIRAKQ